MNWKIIQITNPAMITILPYTKNIHLHPPSTYLQDIYNFGIFANGVIPKTKLRSQ